MAQIGDNMSGQKINDHSFWAGGAGKNMVLPQGVHSKNESSADGAGELSRYEDTSEAVKAQQVISKGKVKSHPMKPHFRQ